jgi:hypothetical protein
MRPSRRQRKKPAAILGLVVSVCIAADMVGVSPLTWLSESCPEQADLNCVSELAARRFKPI